MARAPDVLNGAMLAVEDDRRDYGGLASSPHGFPDNARMVLVWTPRDNAYRIIGMGKAYDRERKLHGAGF